MHIQMHFGINTRTHIYVCPILNLRIYYISRIHLLLRACMYAHVFGLTRYWIHKQLILLINSCFILQYLLHNNNNRTTAAISPHSHIEECLYVFWSESHLPMKPWLQCLSLANIHAWAILPKQAYEKHWPLQSFVVLSKICSIINWLSNYYISV